MSQRIYLAYLFSFSWIEKPQAQEVHIESHALTLRVYI